MGSLPFAIAATRRRLQWQQTFEIAALAVLAASFALPLLSFAYRMTWLGRGAALGALAVGSLIALGALVWARVRPLSDHHVARRLDDSHGLADRISNAVAFEALLGDAQRAAIDSDTVALMHAAIADGRAAAVAVDARRAAPYAMPRHGRAALAFAAAAALLSSLGVPTVDRGPSLASVEPANAAPGAEVTLVGTRLGNGAAGSTIVIGGHAAQVLEWSADKILLKVATQTPLGAAKIELTTPLGRDDRLSLNVVDARDARYFPPEAVVLTPEEKEYIAGLISRLKQIAQDERAPELAAFADAIATMVAATERGEVTKEQLLDALRRAEEELAAGSEPSPAEVDQALAQTGAALSKSAITKSLGQALAKGDLAKAEQEFEKLAAQLDQDQLTPAQKDELAKALDEAAKAFAKKDEAKDVAAADKVEQAKQAVRRLEKEKQDAKTPAQQADKERRLVKAKRELERLEKQQAEEQASQQRRALKRLHKDMEKVAEDLAQRPDKPEQGDPKAGENPDKQAGGPGDKPDDPDGKDGEGENEGEQASEGKSPASRKLREAARETGRVDRDKRKQAAASKATSQMDDLREALRRAKQRGNKGPQNPFGKKESEFARRAAAARRGQGQGQGQGQQGQGQGGTQPGQGGAPGQGQGQGGSDYGDGHDPDFAGAATGVSGDTKDQDLQGLHGKGPSRRETILAAAQKGFASAAYKPVYADYQKIVEEVMRNENVPSAYRHYVKRYFDAIKPR